MTRRGRGSSAAGFVAGGEALALGALVFVAGSLLVLGAWSVVDGRGAAEVAARDAARAVVETGPHTAAGAVSVARRTAHEALSAHLGPEAASPPRWRLSDVRVSGRLERCGRVEVEVEVDRHTARVPFVGGFGTVRLLGSHAERIEPYRDGLPIPPGGVSC